MRMVAALAGRDLRRFFRQPSRVVGSAAQPLILWAVMGAGFAGSFRPDGGADVGYLQYFYPGVVVLTLLFTAIFSTISVIEDRHHGFLQAVLAAPVSRVALVLGKCLGGVAIAAVQAGILLALAPLAGFPLASMNWPLLLVAAADRGARLHRARLRDGVVDRFDAGLSRRDERRAHPAVDAVRRDVPALRRSSRWLTVLTALDPMTYVVSAVRRGFHGAALPLDLDPRPLVAGQPTSPSSPASPWSPWPAPSRSAAAGLSGDPRSRRGVRLQPEEPHTRAARGSG